MKHVWGAVKSEQRRNKREVPISVLALYRYETGDDPAWLKDQLLVTWQITNKWTRSQTLKNMRDSRYADYVAWFGFRNGVYPTEGGVRYFLTTLGRNSDASHKTISVEKGEEIVEIEIQKLNMLLAEAVGVMRQTSVFSPQAWEKALICPDGQIHDAASSLNCISVTETCYQPCTPENPRL